MDSIVTDASNSGVAPPSSVPAQYRSWSPAPESGPGQAANQANPVRGIADQLINLVRTFGYLKARMAAAADPEMSAMFLIGKLVKEGPTRAKDLAEATCSDQSTVSRQVAALVKAGLIERQADPDDGRASILVPTGLGLAKFEKHFVDRAKALEPLMAEWSTADRDQFLRLLSSFNANLEARRDDVARAMARSSVRDEPAAFQPAPFQPNSSTEGSN